MRVTKVYTRAGDTGDTQLAGGEAVSKADLRIEAYGTVDELNALVGVVRAMSKQTPDSQENLHTVDSPPHPQHFTPSKSALGTPRSGCWKSGSTRSITISLHSASSPSPAVGRSAHSSIRPEPSVGVQNDVW